MKDLKHYLEQYKSSTILVLGDAMIDAYIWGKSERMSPEAPIPVVDIETRDSRLGGAANVALNLKSLGLEPTLVCLLGDDDKAIQFENLMKAQGLTCDGILKDKHRKTTQKTRIIVNSKHVLRLDNEQTDPFEQTDLVLELIERQHKVKPIDVLIFEDYNKGLLTDKTIKACIDFCIKHKIKTIVDPKKDNFFAYQNVDVFKPNYKELCEGLGESEREIVDLEHTKSMCKTLREKLNAKAIFLTLSEHGVLILTKDEVWHLPAFKRTIIDVSGAGDTVVSVAATALSTDLNYKDLALISNLAGGLVCEQVGVVPINPDRLENEIKTQ